MGWDKLFQSVTRDLTVTALYQTNTYNVTFLDWDGAVLKTQKLRHGEAATAPMNPSREGHTFIGWDVPFDPVTSHLTVIAQYQIKTFTVTPSAGPNGTIAPDTPQTAQLNQSIVFTINPSPGYRAEVLGSCDGALDGNTYTTSPVSADCTVDVSFSRSFTDCSHCPTMVMIPAGSFVQGSPASEPESSGWERPQRTVNVPTFAMGQTAVTFDQWDACVADGGCTHNPDDQGWGRGNRPVINVSWNDAQQYVAWLSNVTGHDYRLPSESEWEYAARAGTTGRFNTGDCITTGQANFNGEDPATGCPTGVFRDQTLPVASFAPNAFGLYDTHGNVAEWVQDCWMENYAGAPTDGSAWMTGDCSLAVLRGGSWLDRGVWLRSADRFMGSRALSFSATGFRVARSGAF